METEQIPNGWDIIDEGNIPECLPMVGYKVTYNYFYDMKDVDKHILNLLKQINLISTSILKIESTKPKIKLYVEEQARIRQEQINDALKMISNS